MGTVRSTNGDTGKDKEASQKPLARRGLLRAAAGALAVTAGAVALLSHPKQALASFGSVTSGDGTATYEFDNTSSGAGVWGRNMNQLSSPTAPYYGDSGVTGTAGAGSEGVVGYCPGGVGLNSSWGVVGLSDVGVGVRAWTNGSSAAGLYASNFAASGGGTGVFGTSVA
jgi:hypothetical protein